MNAVHITSAANARLKHARTLLRRRARQQHAQLLLEGVRLIQDSISAGYAPALVLFTPEAAAATAALAERAGEMGAVVATIEPALLADLTDTVTPQGVVAVAPWPQVAPGRAGLSLIVDGLRDPGNLGALLRSAAGAGVDQVILLPGVTDPWAPKVMRAGMGAHYRVAIRMARDLAEVRALVGGARLWLADAQAPLAYTAVDWRQPSALIVGGETGGQRLAASWPGVQPVAIPLARQVESLNAAMAATVILFEAVRQRGDGAGTPA